MLTLAVALLVSPQTVSASTTTGTLAQPTAVEYTADSRLNDADLPTDPVTFDECEQNYTAPGPYWFKNRFNICRTVILQIIYRKLENGVPTEVGRGYFRSTLIGIAQDKESRIRFGLRVKYVTTDGEEISDGHLTFGLECFNNDPQRTSVCDHPAEPVDRTVAEWHAGVDPLYWDATTTTTTVPEEKYKTESRGFFSFDLVESSIFVGPPDVVRQPQEFFRCDSASYATRGSRCVFTSVTPTLVFDLNDPTYHESAAFIKDAQEDLTQINPRLVGKKVPGRSGEQTLTYLHPSYDVGNTKTGSRSKVRRVCKADSGARYTKDANGNARQCDEYPFASTYQNSARVDESTVWSFAAKAIAASHNEAGGRLLASWYGREHMLDGDGFYVVVR
ncbi:NucA/NucB deoxyribonuclease domain-containing protein [Amycolatopsis australiensis]|uniref:NucA/NucB deoxyribonuclease domain-containing protein n=1 Tax=Amycolatopsis australiensis TaxID=546364 RepID=UPI0015A57498|nr:hypothetical protein [Amycolatopsis australiensis]